MKDIHVNSLLAKTWVNILLALAVICAPWAARAQEGSQGNTTIFGGAQMTFFSNHNFATGGGGAQPGVILTERAAGNFGVLNFAGANLVSTNASDAGYVDGYVRKYGTGQFIFPVGDNGNLGQFAASGDGTMGAYFHSDPNTATTSNLFTGSDYTALPSGGPFATSSMGPNVDVVSTVEYWDIDGSSATPLTLTWDAGSAIEALTSSQLNKLTIVGWNGTQWVAIDSKMDTTSVLGGTSELTAGSITTTAAIVPNTYTAYTFAALTIPLPVTLVSFNVTKEGQAAQLRWSTTAETNSDRFEVEHSLNGKTWNKIGIVKSHGESKVLRDYQYTDYAAASGGPSHGENLYRLRMVDNDGTFAYSRIRSIRFDGGASDLSIYPNPSSDKLNIRDYANVKEMVISDLNGRSVYHSASFSKGNGTVDVKNLAQGMYIVKITRLNGESSTHKVLVNK
ncbi:T9SS type A sorting domain-containing protein [Dyadobacter crusticola]|uniref:T9SS type A sorting domain-containing protein n=1 Tax=Dyadobacter crusticola TaxID=292407 RepID=UPI00068ACE40|nr:T9SS type A sorting domain-containing protein [Dyadobacter crusticola]